jgi:hypothetical protein
MSFQRKPFEPINCGFFSVASDTLLRIYGFGETARAELLGSYSTLWRISVTGGKKGAIRLKFDYRDSVSKWRTYYF